MKRVCHIIFEHRIFDGRIFHKEVVSLAKHGFEVILLVPSVDNRTLGLKKEAQLSADGAFTSEGITFRTYHYNKKLPKQLNIRQYFCKRDLMKQLIKIDADVYHFHEDGLTLEIAAKLKDVLPNKKLVFDFHEFFLSSYREKKRKIDRINDYIKLENVIVKKADLIFTVTDFISDYYRTLSNCPVVTLFNCQSEQIFPEIETRDTNNGIFWLVHEGRLLFDRGLKLMIEVARKLKSPNVKILCVGNLPKTEQKYFEIKTREYNIQDKFHITGFLPYTEVPTWLAKGKAGLTFMMSDNAKAVISNKFFNYLRYGLPILTLHHPITDKIIDEFELGYTFDTTEVDQIVEHIQQLASNSELYEKLSQNAKTAFQTTYNWENMEKRLIGGYRKLLEDK